MFKCLECGEEYKIKPEYCNCGNDTFEEIKENVKSEATPVSKKNSTPAPEIKVIQRNPVKIQKPKSFNEQYPEFSRFKKSLDPISVFIFLTCIILGLFTILFIGNPKDKIQTEIQEPQTQEKISQNIPSVDEFWDNTPVKIEMPKTPAENKPQEEVLIKDPVKMIEDFLKKNEIQEPVVEQKQPVKQNSQPKSTAKTQKIPVQIQQKTTTNQIPKNTTQKPTTTSTKNIVNMPSSPQDKATKDLLNRIQKNAQASTQSSQPKVSTNTSTVPKTTAKTTVVNNTHTQVQTSKPVLRQKTEIPAKSSTELKQELNNYKASLRNTIGKKINFANVVGDGNCSITFKINSSGKLTDRKFSQQSSNITLNDAVYSAMMATPTFNAPPEGYKNENLTLSVKFYNGNFEIVLN